MPRTYSGAELPALSSGLGPALHPTPTQRRHSLGYQVTRVPKRVMGLFLKMTIRMVRLTRSYFKGLMRVPGWLSHLSCPLAADSVPCLLLPFPSVPAGTRFLSASAHDENWLFNRNDETLLRYGCDCRS